MAVARALGFHHVAVRPFGFGDHEFGRAFFLQRGLDRLQFGDAHARVRAAVIDRVALGGGLSGAHQDLRRAILGLAGLVDEVGDRDRGQDPDDEDHDEQLEEREPMVLACAGTDRRQWRYARWHANVSDGGAIS